MINKKKFFMVQVFAMLCCFCACSGQSITLSEYQNKDVSTKCTQGLLYDYDTYTFKAKVDCKNENTLTKMFFRYRAKQDTQFTHLCDIDLSRTVHVSNACTFTISTVDNCVYDIDVSVKTNRLLSGATLYGVVVARNNAMFTSNNLTLPELYDITNSTGQLIVNGEEFLTEQLNEVISISLRELTILFLCESEAVPCLVEISADDSDLVVQRKTYAKYKRSFEKSTQINVTIKHAACRLDGEFNVLKFRVQKELTEGKTSCSCESMSTVLHFVIGFLSLAVFVLGVTVGIICYREKRRLKSSRTLSKKVYAISDQDTTDPRITALRSLMSSNKIDDDEETHQVPAKRPSKGENKRKSKRIDFRLRLQSLGVNSPPTNDEDYIQINSNMVNHETDGQEKE